MRKIEDNPQRKLEKEKDESIVRKHRTDPKNTTQEQNGGEENQNRTKPIGDRDRKKIVKRTKGGACRIKTTLDKRQAGRQQARHLKNAIPEYKPSGRKKKRPQNCSRLLNNREGNSGEKFPTEARKMVRQADGTNFPLISKKI